MGFWMDYATGTVTDYCPGHFCGFALEVMHAMEEAARAAEGSEPGTLEEAQELAEPPAKGGRRRPRVMAVDSPLRAVVEDAGETPEAAGE
jgi:hypothetical protein